ncbi:MAG: acetate--CoA ligase family protein [Aminobacterium sp.]|nr:acetate--CoA ligase family protein [Aminobacterium sp.]
MFNANLDRLFSPQSVTFIGEGSAWRGACARAVETLKQSAFTGQIFEVHDGTEPVKSSDLAVLDVPLPRVLPWIDICAEQKIPYIMLLSSEQSSIWSQEDINRVNKRLEEKKVCLLGPDSMGFMNLKHNVVISPFQGSFSWEDKCGKVALVSQSGDLGFAIASAARMAGTNFRYVVTTGGTADIDTVDIGRWILKDSSVKLLLFCLEGLHDGIAFLRMARDANIKGVRIGVLKGGLNVSSRQAITSHVSVVAGNSSIWNAAFRQFGILPLRDVDEIVDLARVYNSFIPPNGRKTVIVSPSQGAGITFSDNCFEEGLKVPSIPEDLQREFKKSLPDNVYVKNPIDLASLGAEGSEDISYLLRRLMDSPNLDIITAILTESKGEEVRNILAALLDVARQKTHPIVCCSIGDIEEEEVKEMLNEEGIPFFTSPRRCARALAGLSAPVPSLDKMMPVSCEECVIKGEDLLPKLPQKMTEYDAKRLLAFHNIDVTREYLCQSLEEALEAAEMIGYPVALKVMSPNIVHKSEARIIALNLNSEEELRNAYGRTLEKARLANPEADIRGVLVQEMLKDGIECTVAIKRDTIFGSVLSVGLGGVYASAVRDSVLRIAPVDEENAMAMIRDLKGYSLLKGAWGRPSYDVAAFAKMVARLSNLACIEDQLVQLEINPVFVKKKGSVVVDAFVVRR